MKINQRTRTFIVREDKRFLILIRKLLNQKTDSVELVLLLPGGGVDPEESLLDANVREVTEEVGMVLKDVTLFDNHFI
jgi:8-oxo-dGTP pyrophosphatase MutT (NUDIX family)